MEHKFLFGKGDVSEKLDARMDEAVASHNPSGFQETALERTALYRQVSSENSARPLGRRVCPPEFLNQCQVCAGVWLQSGLRGSRRRSLDSSSSGRK